MANRRIDENASPAVERFAFAAFEPEVLRSFRVYFDTNSVAFDEPAKARLGDVTGFLRDNAYEGIRIVGHADTVGDADYNLRLSRARAMAVRNVLIDAGVDPQQILVQSLGENDPTLALGDGVAAEANRVVEIHIDIEGPYVLFVAS